MRTLTTLRLLLALACLPLSCLALGCDTPTPASDAGPSTDGATVELGDLNVILESESTITSGLAAGDGLEDVQDGWGVTFEDYIVMLGDIVVRNATDPENTASAPERFAVDLADVPESGLSLWSIEQLASGRWEFSYAIDGEAGVTRHPSVTEEQFTAMVAAGETHRITGVMQQTGGRSCPPSSLVAPGDATPSGEPNSGGDPCYDNPEVRFELRVGPRAATRFGPCEIDEVPGFAITSGAPTVVAATIHGDHVFFNGFPEGGEGGVMRLAQWLADCDLDLDGVVTGEELERIAPADLPEIDSRFQLGGSPISPLRHMHDYVAAQLRTQGHFQGEGECAFRRE